MSAGQALCIAVALVSVCSPVFCLREVCLRESIIDSGSKLQPKSEVIVGVVYLKLTVARCDPKASGASSEESGVESGVASVPFRVGVAAEEDTQVQGTLEKFVACPDGDCAVRVAVTQPFLGDDPIEQSECMRLSAGSSLTKSSQGGGSSSLTAILISDGSKNEFVFTLSEDGQFIAQVQWKSAKMYDTLKAIQQDQSSILVLAYKAVRKGKAFMAGKEGHTGFLECMEQIRAQDVVRTRELVSEWVCGQILQCHEDECTTHSVDQMSRTEVVSAICVLDGPRSYESLASYEEPKECSTSSVGQDIAALCEVLHTLKEQRGAEVAAVKASLSDGLLAATMPLKSAMPGRPLRVLVVGGGPVGLLAAIQTQISAMAHSAPVEVVVLEKRHEFASRTNVLKFLPYSLPIFEAFGAMSLLSPKELKILESRGDHSISIASVQRALWRLARILGLPVFRGQEFLAYCPPQHKYKSWFAVTKQHKKLDDLDTIERQSWAGGVVADDSSWDVGWLKEVCSDKDTYMDSVKEFFEFDIVFAADGGDSKVRDQARHYTDKPAFGEHLAPIHIDRLEHSKVFGATINYKPQEEVSWDEIPNGGFGKSCSQGSADGSQYGVGKAYNFMSANWCYFAQVLFEDIDKDKLQGMYTKSPAEQADYVSQAYGIDKMRFLYNDRHVPDISVFPVGFQYVRDDKIAYVQTSAENVPMLLVLAGDSYAPGFFPLGNGMNKGMARLVFLLGLGVLAKDGFNQDSAEMLADRYNHEIKESNPSSGQAEENVIWMDFMRTNPPQAQFMADIKTSRAGQWIIKYQNKMNEQAATIKAFLPQALPKEFSTTGIFKENASTPPADHGHHKAGDKGDDKGDGKGDDKSNDKDKH